MIISDCKHKTKSFTNKFIENIIKSWLKNSLGTTVVH